MRISRAGLAVLAVLGLALTACSTESAMQRDLTRPMDPAVDRLAGVETVQDPSLLSPYGLAADDANATSSYTGVPGAGAPLAAVPELAAADSASGATSRGSAGVTGAIAEGTGPGALRAGYVDDNDGFAAYLDYLGAYRGPGRELSVDGRQIVTVTTTDGLPLLGASVTIGDTAAPSHVDGRALFFDVEPGTPVEVAYGEATATAVAESDGSTTVALDTDRVDASDLTVDLQLVLDTTGSMGDEIVRLNESLDDIATRLGDLESQPEVRYGLTVYRDQGDAYVFRTHDFTDLETFRDELADTVADGGGDTPEALDEAFHASVVGPDWGRDTGSVELMLLVADAPSHLRDEDGTTQYAADVADARARGIEVVPLAASGADDDAEHEFRQLAQQTLGTFFFLTYGEDGSPGDGTTHHVDDYATGSLADMVVGHVGARLATYDVPVGATPPSTPSTPPGQG